MTGQVAEGNRKDIRDAVEAAHKAAPGCVHCNVIKLQILNASFCRMGMVLVARIVIVMQSCK